MENSETIIKALEKKIESEKVKIKDIQKRLDENFCYSFPWVGEELYKSHYLVNEYTRLLENINLDKVDESINFYLDYHKRFLGVKYNVREECSGSLHREVSTWKYICVMEMVEFITKISKIS